MRIVIDIDWDDGSGLKFDKNYSEYPFAQNPDVRQMHEALLGLDNSYRDARAALEGIHKNLLKEPEKSNEKGQEKKAELHPPLEDKLKDYYDGKGIG